MVVLHNESLKTFTTFHLGGIAKNLWIPDSISELKDLLISVKAQPVWFISGGSNVLINDRKVFQNVISMKNVDKSLDNLDNGRFYVGASNRIQKVISSVNEHGYGGFEELIGLPALFGGIIYMNAGVGFREKSKFTIGDFIERVKVLNRKTYEIGWIDKAECHFGHRYSVFQKDEYVILGAEILLQHQDIEVSTKRIEDRRKYIKCNQEFGKGCFGSCFSVANGKLLRLVSFMPDRVWGGVRQSYKNCNWLVNNGTCTFKQVKTLINFCVLLHKMTFQKIAAEVRIWE